MVYMYGHEQFLNQFTFGFAVTHQEAAAKARGICLPLQCDDIEICLVAQQTSTCNLG